MGLLNAITQSFKGDKGIQNVENAVGLDDQAITPENAKYGIYRSTPVLKDLREFTLEESSALEALASKRKITSKAVKKALRALKAIKFHDTEDQKAFNNYQKNEALLTTEQVESNANLAKSLEGMRSRFALAAQGLQAAINSENEKQKAIFGTSEKAKEFSNLW